jgi:hypothetical protein
MVGNTMKISEFKAYLSTTQNITFVLPNGSYVPPHFHLTEVGLVSKKFIDCGGTVREETKINFQLWKADDFDHRLAPGKAIAIIEDAEEKLCLQDQEIEVEYQSETIGKYSLSFSNGQFLLLPTETDCLAKEKCGIPEPENIAVSSSCCSPDSGCC